MLFDWKRAAIPNHGARNIECDKRNKCFPLNILHGAVNLKM